MLKQKGAAPARCRPPFALQIPFRGAPGHPTEGTAIIYQVADGSRILRFTNFRTTNGPNVHVYMVAADDAKDNASVQHAGFIDLGPLKGNVGDQNYVFGPDVDLSRYRAVSVWCKRFSVNFGTAPLMSEHVTSRN